MSETQLEKDKQSLIELIEWYRDSYHKSDFCHSKMIDKINEIKNENELSVYEKIVDSWLD